jgi:hypothetical protein
MSPRDITIFLPYPLKKITAGAVINGEAMTDNTML